ncbi:MAG: TerB family tellurite resistance protein [Cyclobacteriaceae bacterium]|nr:TerB family tellurite resistance protein [Cyclobacteriaceae bacterium]
MVKEQLNILIQMAASDGMIAEKEIRLIQTIAEAKGIGAEEVDELIKNPKPISNLDHLTSDQRFEYLYNVIQLMKADGQVFKSEIVFCEDMAERLGYNRKVVAELSSKIYSDPSITADRDSLREKASKFLR